MAKKDSDAKRSALRNPRFSTPPTAPPAPDKNAAGTLTVNAGDFTASPKAPGTRPTIDPFVPNPNLRFVYHVSYWSAGTIGMAEYEQDCLVSSWAHVQQMQAGITQRLAQAGLPLANPPTIICFSLLRTQIVETDAHNTTETDAHNTTETDAHNTAGPAGKEGEEQA